MKKLIVYLFTIVLGASIPIYFLLIWQPLRSEEAMSNNTIENISEENNINTNEEVISNSENVNTILLKQKDTVNSLYNYLDNDRREKLNTIINKLSIVDLIKIDDFFADKDDNEKIKKGVELAKKRMSSSDYDILKNILETYIDSSILK